MSLEGLSPTDKMTLWKKLGPDEYFKIARRDARRSAEADVENEIRMRSQWRQELRAQDAQKPGAIAQWWARFTKKS